MTTLSEVINEARHEYLMSGARDQRNILASTVNTTDTTFTFTYDLGNIDTSAKLSIGLEDCHVWGVNEASKTATVTRGEFGSTAATHPAGALARVNPIFTDAQILRTVNRELAALSSPANGLFQVATVDVSYNASINGYDLASVTDVLQIMSVRYQAIGPENEWPVVERSMWEHGRTLDTASFSSGQAIFVRGYIDPGRTIRVTYRAPYTTLSLLTDDVEYVSGLHAEAHDILALGAAIRLTAGREIRRNFDERQGDTRRAAEVPPGANLGANRGLMQLRQQRIQEEAARLSVMYPARLR